MQPGSHNVVQFPIGGLSKAARLKRQAKHGAFTNQAHILWVCHDLQTANDRWQEMGCPQGIRMSFPGQHEVGVGFDEIVIDNMIISTDGPDTVKMTSRWVEDSLRPRLNANGKMRELS
jgi:hypothetical protein